MQTSVRFAIIFLPLLDIIRKTWNINCLIKSQWVNFRYESAAPCYRLHELNETHTWKPYHLIAISRFIEYRIFFQLLICFYKKLTRSLKKWLKNLTWSILRIIKENSVVSPVRTHYEIGLKQTVGYHSCNKQPKNCRTKSRILWEQNGTRTALRYRRVHQGEARQTGGMALAFTKRCLLDFTKHYYFHGSALPAKHFHLHAADSGACLIPRESGGGGGGERNKRLFICTYANSCTNSQPVPISFVRCSRDAHRCTSNIRETL